MGYVASRKFCCCLPVRFGVFCMTFLGLGIGGALGGYLWYEIHLQLTNQLHLDQSEVISLWFVTISYTFLALISFIGLVGCLGRLRGAVIFFAYTVTIQTLVNIGVGILFLYTLFHRDPGTVAKCESSIALSTTGPNDEQFKHWVCSKGFEVFRICITIAFVIIWIFQIAGIFIAFDYVGQLNEEMFVRLEEEDKAARGIPPAIIVPEASVRTTYDRNLEGANSEISTKEGQ
ncbi:hypothetical protein ABKN59_004846 [Abortiporus biennis]